MRNLKPHCTIFMMEMDACVRLSRWLYLRGKTEHYIGSQGKSFEEQANDLEIRTEAINQINPQSEGN